MEYQKLYIRIWDDENFRQLSERAKLVWIYLLGNRMSNFVGLYVLIPASGADDIQIKPAEFKSSLDEICKLGMAIYDEVNRVILVKNFLQYNPIGGDKGMKGVEKSLKSLPRTKLFYDFRDLLEQPNIMEEGGNADIIDVANRFLGVMNLEGLEPPSGDEESGDKPVRLNIDGLVEAWNEVCGTVLPNVLSLPERRKSAIRARMKEHPDLEEWKGIFRRIIGSPFLRGENDKGWRADFDWCLNVNNLAKILEGKYDDRKNPNREKTGMDAVRALAEEETLDPRNQMGGEDDEGSVPPGDSFADKIF